MQCSLELQYIIISISNSMLPLSGALTFNDAICQLKLKLSLNRWLKQAF